MLSGLRRIGEALSPRRRFLPTFDDRVGNFSQAQLVSRGFNDAVITEQAFLAARAVIRGEAVFERDGVLFQESAPREPIVMALRQISPNLGFLRVLDIGGGLGSSYWQNRGALPGVEWTVVERNELVAKARDLPDNPVRFRTDLDEALHEEWDCVLLSSVLQYLPHPHELLSRISALPIHSVIVDRTPVHSGAGDIACVQHVPPHIYPGSYAAWVFATQGLEADVRCRRIVSRFPGIEPPMRTRSGASFEWRGFVAVRED